jgi:hypothetical protein
VTFATDEGTLLHSELLRCLDYDSLTGQFTIKVRRANIMPGRIAGYLHKPSGYQLITVNYRKYKAHRLAWFYITGKWPGMLDHINRQRNDNRIENLREVNSSENLMNTNTRADNTSGRKGVYFDIQTRKWRAYISLNGKRMYFGRYSSKEIAIKARIEAETKYFGEMIAPLAQERTPSQTAPAPR